MLKIENVSKHYANGFNVLTDVTFDVTGDDFVLLAGPNGSGKTTLMRLINQTEDITSGDIKINGFSIKNMDKTDVYRHISFVDKCNYFFPQLTIEDNVMLFYDRLGWNQMKRKNCFNDLMDLIGFSPDEYRNLFPHQLIWEGQKEKLVIARALATDPSIILMDEPDFDLNWRLTKDLSQIQKEIKKPVLYAGKKLDDFKYIADKAVILANEVLQYDTPAEILRKPKNKMVLDIIGEDHISQYLFMYTVKDLANVVPLGNIPPNSSHSVESMPLHTPLKIALSYLSLAEGNSIVIVDEFKNKRGILTTEKIKEFINI